MISTCMCLVFLLLVCLEETVLFVCFKAEHKHSFSTSLKNVGNELRHVETVMQRVNIWCVSAVTEVAGLLRRTPDPYFSSKNMHFILACN